MASARASTRNRAGGLPASSRAATRMLSQALGHIGGDRLGFGLTWIALIVAFGIALPGTYLTRANIATMLASQANLLVLALATVLPLTSGDFDLSIAGVSGVSSILIGVLNVNHHVAIVPAIALALLAGLLVGVVNCLLIVVIGAESIVVTLGMATFLGGLVLWLSGASPIGGVSPHLVDVMIGHRLLGVALVFYYALALCILLWYVQRFTVLGQRMLFVGQNRDVARLSGIRVDRIRIGSLLAGSGLAAISGVIAVGVSGAADPSQAPALLLPAFAAAFLGAAAIGRGRFGAWSCLLSIYFLISGITGLQQLGSQSYVQDLFYGGALALAVTMAKVSQRRRERRALRRDAFLDEEAPVHLSEPDCSRVTLEASSSSHYP